MENGFHDFLQHREKRGFYVGKENDGVELPDENPTQINEERDSRHGEERYSREDRKVMDEVDFYKDRLYKKIDSCFLRYGLEGLKRIDEELTSKNVITKTIPTFKRTIEDLRSVYRIEMKKFNRELLKVHKNLSKSQ